CCCLMLVFRGYGHHRDLHSFPTRRSSDLSLPNDPVAAVRKIATSRRRLKFRGITIQCALSLRKSAMDLAMSFIIADSEPSFSTPCKSASEADETMSPRQMSVCGLPFTSTGHI